MRYLNRTVWLLGLVSLFTDMASEMLYPVMPIYLKSIGFTVLWIGLLEGVAEAVAGLSKGYFGHWSDLSGRRAPFVRTGYSLSALSKPLLALFSAPLWVLFARTLDRLGKGLRTGARDAMLSDAASDETRGRVFGFHRAMDTLGAVIGPLSALAYLYFYPSDYRSLFFIAFLPGLFSIAATFLLRDQKRVGEMKIKPRVSLKNGIVYWKQARPEYRAVLKPLLLFALFNSSDAFLLLRIKEAGLPDSGTIGVYIFYNLVYALLAFPAGILADRLGLKKTFLFGLCCFSMAYAGMAFEGDLAWYGLLFVFYGAYAAATDGISKAWISKLAPAQETAQAIGAYAGLQSLSALVAGALGGLMWQYGGSALMFGCSAAAALAAAVWLWLAGRPDGPI